MLTYKYEIKSNFEKRANFINQALEELIMECFIYLFQTILNIKNYFI